MNDDQKLDDLILSLAKPRWQKTALIIAKARNQLDAGLSDDRADEVARRIEHLVRADRLESQGDLSLWRFSEIRLPASSE